jgi:hypothetical protein
LRVASLPFDKIEEEVKLAKTENISFTADVLEDMKKTSFDIWRWNDSELIVLLEKMFETLGIMAAFPIDREKLRRFLVFVKYTYNMNPFHNFRHCFCVTQMVNMQFYYLYHLLIIISLDVRDNSRNRNPQQADPTGKAGLGCCLYRGKLTN